MNMRYAIHLDSALFAFFGYDSIKVAKMFPTRCLSMVSLSLAVCVSGRGTAKCLSCAGIILHHLMSYMTSGAPITSH